MTKQLSKYLIKYIGLIVHSHLSDFSSFFRSAVDFPLIKGYDERLHFLRPVINIGTFRWGFIVYQRATTSF